MAPSRLAALLSALILSVLLVLPFVDLIGTTDAAPPDLLSFPPGTIALDTPAGVDQGKPLIIDHTCTDLSQIPPYWIEQAKALAIHYAHTSHGSQINSGLAQLDQVQPMYDWDVFNAGASPPTSLSCDAGALCMYDGNPPETYITPEDYWETQDGRDRTMAVANTALFNYSMWSWCGQQSYYSEAQVQLYLDTIASFEAQYPGMRFILMTGHTDGGSATLERNNNMVRQYAVSNDMILFDFADIETYDPLGGGPYVNNSEGTCTWCVDFCANHPEYCTDLPGSCAHSSTYPEDRLFCKLKGNAFWWMMARLAGWSGPSAGEPDKLASTDRAFQGDPVQYTVVVRDLDAPLTATVYLTDVVPAGLGYVPGSLSATSGTVDDGSAPSLYWSGPLDPDPVVTITYAVTVTTADRRAVTNTAIFAVLGYPTLTRTATLLLNPVQIFMPLVMQAGP